MKKKIYETLSWIAIAYMLLALVNAGLALKSGTLLTPFNAIVMAVWCSIAVGVLQTYPLFDRFPWPIVMGLQYLIALSLVLMTIVLSAYIEPLHPNAYRDGILSFSIPYVMGAIYYYIELHRTAKRQNALLQAFKDK